MARRRNRGTARPATGGSSSDPKSHRARWIELIPVFAVVGLAVLAYANALNGDFIYDDRKQILDNHLIQDSRYFGQALRSDVWAFKQREAAASNYWRPTFVLWLMANYRVFGLSSSFGWHLTSVLLHALAAALAYQLMRRLDLSRPRAFAIAALFAAHPVHVESVAWISGAPDLLMSAGLLGSLCLTLEAWCRRSKLHALGAYFLYAVGLLAKESAIVFPLLVAIAAWEIRAHPGDSGRQRLRRAVLAALPFAAIGIGLFALRWSLLGRFQIETPWRLGAFDLLLNAPQLVAFYLRQALLPLWLGPSYPLRALTADNLGAANFWLPSLVLLCAAGLCLWWARRRRRVLLGSALFLLPLVPAFNLNAFIQEQLTHDRYLYLPLLGVLLVVFAPAAGASRAGTSPAPTGHGDDRPSAAAPSGAREKLAAWAGLILCIPLLAQTWRYNGAWSSELALWEWGVRFDPTSSFNHAQLGHALLEEGEVESALTAVNRALEISPVTSAYFDRARIAELQGRLADAEHDLSWVLSHQPDNFNAYEQLARVLQAQGRVGAAIELLERGREQVPYRRCAFTSNLAVLLYLSGDKGRALAELEAARALAGTEQNAACQLALFHLASLYQELGRNRQALGALRDYLEISATARDPQNQRARGLARQNLRQLGG